MDLNYLYKRHQISLYMSDHAACAEARGVHRDFTRAYAALIATALRQHTINRLGSTVVALAA